tara:strand:+ start:69 stop:749 length:681 start_codon:yes stop_codon:yes gene_type:complete
MDKPNLKLIYFKLRALAETPKMMMEFAGLKYSYIMAEDYFKKPWEKAKNDVPFNQLPLLIVNETIEIWQSNSIVRFLAPLTGTIPDDRLMAAQADSIFESTHELFFPLNPTVNVVTGEQHKALKKQFLEMFPRKLKNFSRLFKSLSDGPFFFGEKPYYCDFSAYHHFSLAKILDPEVLNGYSRVSSFMEAFEKLPKVNEYLEKRPEIIDVGTNPKLIIDGIKYETG